MPSIRILVVLGVTAALAGCMGGVAELPGAMEQPPLVNRLDVQVGSSFPGPSRGYVLPTPLVRFPIGEASASRFRQAWGAMFAKVVDLPDWPPWRSATPDVDGVIELNEVAMQVTLGNDMNVPDRIRVRYQVCLYEPNAVLVKCWTSEAESEQQRRPGECLPDVRVCLTQQADLLMRKAIARFLLEFDADSETKRWAARKAHK